MVHLVFDFGDERNEQLRKIVEEKIVPMMRDEAYGQIDIGIKKGKIVNSGVRVTDNDW